MPPVSPCPEPQQLDQYALGQTSPAQVELFTQHLAQCPTCAARLDTLRQRDALAVAVRQGAALNSPTVSGADVLINHPQNTTLLNTTPASPDGAMAGGPLPAVPGYEMLA